jgi:hypothetical protein
MAANPGATGQSTDFTTMGLQARFAWAKSVWETARRKSFAMNFMGGSSNAAIQRITELTSVQGASKAVIQLVGELLEDGVAGDGVLEGNEDVLRAFEQEIQYDQLRTATRNKGRVTDKKSTVDFRNQSKDKLGRFFGDRIDQLAFLTLSGIDYDVKPSGELRPVTSAFLDLTFRTDVTAPTANRHIRVLANGTLAAGDTAAVVAADLLNYKSLVRAKALAKETGMRGISVGSDEIYHVFTTPTGMADLRLDADFLENIRSVGVRGDKNAIFAGTSSVMLDGMVVHEYRYVYNTTGLTATNKWGVGGNVEGVRNLMLGAQAMGFADFGAPGWVEKTFDYGNNHGIATNKIFGMLKPKFQNDFTDSVEDYGVMVVDSAQSTLV